MHLCGVPMFVMMLAEVLFPILTDWGLPVRKFRRKSQMVGCRQFVRGDCVEGGAVVKER